MAKLFYLMVLAVAGFQLASGQSISCYDCDPLNFAADCGDPVGNAVRSTPCTPDPNILNGTAICVSAFMNVTGVDANRTGIYRGCRTLGPAVANFCDWFREENQGVNTTVLSCEACNSTRCNIVGFRDDGSSGAHDILTASVVVLVFNAVFVLLLSRKE